MIKLTRPQHELIGTLRNLKHINRGVGWYGVMDHPKFRSKALDDRVCNALVRKGVLIALGGEYGEYRLSDEYKEIEP